MPVKSFTAETSAPLPIGLLAVPNTMPAMLLSLCEVFAAVGQTWTEVTGEPPAGRLLAPRILAPSAEPLATPLGVPLVPHATWDEPPAPELIIVGDLAFPLDCDPRGRWPEAAAWLKQRHDEGAVIASVCSGAVLLADAGLLDGLEATTHWAVAELLRAHYPSVRLHPERILQASGAEHRIITCGGQASWEELALYVVARWSGEEEARRIARLFVLGDRSEGQLPYAAMTRPRRHEDALVAKSQAWIAEHYASENPVAGMARVAGLVERTFSRRFKAATGYAPLDYVQTLRLEEAKQLLESSRTPTDSVAAEVGYEDPAYFRRLFKRRVGTTPARYRRRFSAIGSKKNEEYSPLAGD